MTLTGLVDGTTYTINCFAQNSAGYGPSTSVLLQAGTVPGKPTTVNTVLTADKASVTITWTAPGSNGGFVIEGYTVEIRTVVGLTPGTGTFVEAQ
jgi:Flp pilus assembly protein CpaB